MRTLTSFALLLTFAAPLAAQAAGKDSTHKAHDKAQAANSHADPDKAVADAGALPSGWNARTDGGASTANVKFVPMGKGYHVTLGPAVILYRDADKVSGKFHTLATFTQTKAPTHAEGYGLFFGGKALDGEGQKYTYFLVRGDGTYLIKQRDGAKTTNISQGWVAHPAVKKADAAGKAVNLLEIDGKASKDGTLSFKVNGQEVWSTDAKTMDINGIVGLRVNHNLDVHIDGFDIHRPM
jgi:hypothetical protein